jgi:hypothetical protein
MPAGKTSKKSLRTFLRASAHTTAAKIAIPIVAVAAIIGIVFAAWGPVESAVAAREVTQLNNKIKKIYTTAYQAQAAADLKKARDAKTHDQDNIYTQENPYGTNTTGLYVYFTTKIAAKVSYRVSTPNTDYADFTATPDGGDEYKTTHEFQALGLIPNQKNTITVTITYKNGESFTRTIQHKGASLLGLEDVQLQATKVNTSQSVGNGLYAVLGNDSDRQDFMYLYDTHGTLRGEVPTLFYRVQRLLFDKNGLMWFSASTTTFAGMDKLGRLEKIYKLGGSFIVHHDYVFDDDQNILLLATDLSRKDNTIQDQVVKLDTHTGKTTHLVDMGTLLASYKKTTTRGTLTKGQSTNYGEENGTVKGGTTSTNATWDWMHLNTIQYLTDGSIIVSSRETSTIYKIGDVESKPKLDYMIGESSFWKGTAYESKLLKKIGTFAGTGGQHTVTYQADPSLPEGEYYLYMFDNNLGWSTTRPDYDWAKNVSGINIVMKSSTAHSEYRKYLVNENAGTVKEVAQFNVPYSSIVSSVQDIGNNQLLIDSGVPGILGVYSTSGSLIQQYKIKVEKTYVYRVYQYGFHGYWFA